MLYWSTCYTEVHVILKYTDRYTFLITQMLRADDWITLSQDRVCWSKECVNIQSWGCFIFYPSTFQRFYIFFKNPSWSNESSFCYLLQTRWKVFTNGNFLLHNQLSYCSSLLRQLVTTFLTHIRHTRNSFADQMQKYTKPWICFGNKAWMQRILCVILPYSRCILTCNGCTVLETLDIIHWTRRYGALYLISDIVVLRQHQGETKEVGKHIPPVHFIHAAIIVREYSQKNW